MQVSVLETVAPPVVAGVGLGALFAVVAAGLFAVGRRLFPDPEPPADRTRSGGRRRRAEIRAYLAGIGERVVEDYPIAGTSVDFYLPERDVAVTFDAHAYFRIRNAASADVVLVEHEMPGRHLGRRLPFEVPEYGPEPADVRQGVRRAFDTLGLPTTATREEVRSAYRERIKEAHPDHGGDEESFRRVREAYVTADGHATRPAVADRAGESNRPSRAAGGSNQPSRTA